jgi:hypothetical protein
VEFLSGTDAWAYVFAKAKGSDDKTRERSKALAVGYALRNFRLGPIKKSGSGSSLYDKKAAMEVIARHVPQNLPYLPEVPEPTLPFPQVADTKGGTEGTEYTEASAESGPSMFEPDEPSVPCRVHGVHDEFWQRPDGGWVCARCHPQA